MPSARPSLRLLGLLATSVVVTSPATRPPLPETSSLHFLPPGTLTSDEVKTFADAVKEVRGRAYFLTPYSRHGGLHRAADKPMGSKLVRPPQERRVTVTEGFRAHLDAAIQLPFLPDARLRATALPPDTQLAIHHAVRLESRLPAERRSAIQLLAGLARSLRPLSKKINRLMGPTVHRIAADFNSAFAAALVDGLRWLDRRLVQDFVEGFKIVGLVPDSGVYRAIEPLGIDVHERLAFFNATARLYNLHLHRRLAERASYRGDPIPDQAVANKTAAELAKGVLVGPFRTIPAVHDHLASLFPTLPRASTYPRAMPRFPIEQKGSWRAIDDARSNGANAATQMLETVTTPHFIYPAIVARAAAEAASARGLPPRQMLLALADLSMAYRTVPVSQPWYTVFGIFDPYATPPGPAYYFLPGHNFGLQSAVVNFNRFPELVVVAARAMALAPADHYYDDFIVPDLHAGGRTALDVVETLVRHLGLGRARRPHERVRSPELDPLKTQESAAVNTVLGVIADFSTIQTDGAVHFRPTPERVAAILLVFEIALEKGKLLPHEASRLRGKLYFLLSAAYGAIGRAATLPLVQRQYRDTDHSFLPGSELHHSYLFFRALLPRLPDLEMAVVQSSRPPLVVYTDASFWVAKPRRGECASKHARLRGALGAVVYDPEDGSVRVADSLPDWRLLLSSWRDDQKTYIAELETLAAIAVYSTFPDLFRDRAVNHWVDNTVALSALVNGYSGKSSLAKAVNVFYLQTFGLRTRVYFDWVPSKANIADLPSREGWAELAHELRGLRSSPSVPLVAPDVASWSAPLDFWIERFEAPGAHWAA